MYDSILRERKTRIEDVGGLGPCNMAAINVDYKPKDSELGRYIF